MKEILSKQTVSRRTLLKAGAGTAAAVPLAALLGSRRALAQDLPELSVDDPAAKALAYVHDVSEVDPAQNPMFVAGSTCANCQLYTGGSEPWGPCSIFPGRAVNANGWCRTWIKKAG